MPLETPLGPVCLNAEVCLTENPASFSASTIARCNMVSLNKWGCLRRICSQRRLEFFIVISKERQCAWVASILFGKLQILEHLSVVARLQLDADAFASDSNRAEDFRANLQMASK